MDRGELKNDNEKWSEVRNEEDKTLQLAIQPLGTELRF